MTSWPARLAVELDLEGGDVEVLALVDGDRGRSAHRRSPRPAVEHVDRRDGQLHPRRQAPKVGQQLRGSPCRRRSARHWLGSPYSSNAMRASVSPAANDAALGVVGRLQVELLELLLERLVLLERHRQRRAHRDARRVEERELLLDVVDDRAERQAQAPDEPDARRRVRLRLDAAELGDDVRSAAARRRPWSRVLPSRVVSKNSSSVSVCVWPRTNCRIGRVDAGDRDLGDLRRLGERVLGRVELHRDHGRQVRPAVLRVDLDDGGYRHVTPRRRAAATPAA